MTNYIIVQEVTAAALVALVNHEMTGGRIPLGSPFVWHDPSDGKTVLCQAMIYPSKGNLSGS
jgi:archaellum biogenesis ATPase FlaH